MINNIKTLDDLNFDNQRVLLRVDFNVPIDKQGKILDDTRIVASLPTIQYILSKGGIPLLISHMGRPKGKPDPLLSLAPCAQRLSQLLQRPVIHLTDCVGQEVERRVAMLEKGDLCLLENLRFHPAEEDPDEDPQFAKDLAKLATLYVDDAFGCAHRPHASIYELPKYFPEKKAAGLLMQREYLQFSKLLADPALPFFSIIGGAKISSKIGVLHALLPKVDRLFIGGAMAFTFLKAQNIPIGNSLYEESLLSQAKNLLKRCAPKIYLPIDLVIAEEIKEGASTRVVSTQEGIPEGWIGVDIGPGTIKEWGPLFHSANTLFWNGPLGIFEIPAFAEGTYAIATLLSKLSAITVVGGGDSLAAIKTLHIDSTFSHLSTGGGACLEFLEFGHLPGLDALKIVIHK